MSGALLWLYLIGLLACAGCDVCTATSPGLAGGPSVAYSLACAACLLFLLVVVSFCWVGGYLCLLHSRGWHKLAVACGHGQDHDRAQEWLRARLIGTISGSSRQW